MSELPPLPRIYPPGPDARLLPIFNLDFVKPVIFEEPRYQQHHADLTPYDASFIMPMPPRTRILAGQLNVHEAPARYQHSTELLNMGKNREVVRAVERLRDVNRDTVRSLSLAGLHLGVYLKDRHDHEAARSVALQFLGRLGRIYGSCGFVELTPPPPPSAVAKVRRRLFHW